MRYVCKSLTLWPTGALVIELKLEPCSPEMDGYLSRDTMGHLPDSLIVPMPVVVMEFRTPEDALEQFMQRLTRLPLPLGMVLQQKEQISIALTSLAKSVQSFSSTRESWLYTTQLITD